jgi:polyisoprenoid-binding protein YceI
MKITAIAITALLSLSASAFAEKLVFDFKDPKGVNTIRFTLDAPLETISGTASDISGTVTADPENPADVTGTIVVQAQSLHVPNPLMKQHMHGDEWLDVTTHETITFELKEVSNVKREGDTGTADVKGTFTLRGISKDITVPVRVTYLPGRLGDRSPGLEGDLLVIRSDYTIKRSDFGIKPGEAEDKVADEITVSMSIAGAAPKG